jgi:hypothetical protein
MNRSILSILCFLILLACGQESEQLSRLHDTEFTGKLCNEEDVNLYLALRSEAGSDTSVIGWRKIAPRECQSMTDWLLLKSYKSYYIQSDKGLYIPKGETYDTAKTDTICFPFDVSLASNFSYTYNGTRVAETGACPSGFRRYQVTYLKSVFDWTGDDAATFTFRLAGGSFDGSQKFSSQPVAKGKSYDEVVNELADIKQQHEKVKRDYESCERDVQNIIALQDVFKIKLTDLDALRNICGYENKELEDLKERIRTFRREAFDGLKGIALSMRSLYESVLLKGKAFGIVEPIKTFIDQLGMSQLTRPSVDAQKSGSGNAFFEGLVNEYKQTFAKYYQQESKSFFVSVLAYLSTFSSFGEDYVKTEDIDEKSYLDYLNAVEIGEKYFSTIDFDKDEYGYPLNSPVPNDIKKTIRDDIKPQAASQALALDDELKKWEGTLTQKQLLILETIRFLGQAFKNLPGELIEVKNRLVSITEGAVAAVKDFTVCAAKVGASGDYGDWYEVTTGYDICTGEEITKVGRAVTAVGIVAGSGKFWRALGEFAGVAVVTQKVMKDAGKFADDVVQIIGPKRFEEIRRMAPRDRPDPSEYLPSEYIQKHLANFDQGAARFTTKRKLDTFGPANTDGKTFVMPAAEADDLFKSVNGDKRAIEKALGLKANELDGDVLVRIDVPNPKKVNVAMPSGKERSANENWLPGGKVPGGNNEAVVDLGGVPLGPDGWMFKTINL